MRGATTRLLTIVAAAVLAFDGVALVLGGVWLRRPLLMALGAGLTVGSGLVMLYGRWYRRQVTELDTARRALAAEARALQDLIRRN